jgi:hypothetical protein
MTTAAGCSYYHILIQTNWIDAAWYIKYNSRSFSLTLTLLTRTPAKLIGASMREWDNQL